MTRPAVRMVALLLVAGLVVLPVLAACSVSWRDPTLKAMRACTLVEMANNVTLKDVFIQENRSAVLADMIGLMQGNLSVLINGTYKAEAILWASDSDTANRTGAENTASLMALANRTGAENTASLMALANRTGAANDAALMAAVNRTLAANLSIMAQSLIVPSTGGATLYAPNESLGPVPVTYVGFPRGQWNASIAVGMPTAWTGGPLTAAFYWTADSSEGTVEWDFAGRCTGTDNQTISSYLGANTTILDTMGTKDNVYISDATAGTTMAGTPAGGAYCLLNFRRLSGAGTLTSEAKLLGVRIYYPVA